jgi:phasin family protein
MTTKPQEQFSDLQQKTLDAAMRIAQLSISNSQRIIELQVETAKSLFQDSIQNVKSLTEIKDPKEMLEMRTDYARSATEKLLATARRITEIATETQTEFGKIVGSNLVGGGQEIAEAVQKMFSFNPAAGQGMQTAMGTLQQAMDMARSAYDQITRASTDAFGGLGKSAAAGGGTKHGAKGKGE